MVTRSKCCLIGIPDHTGVVNVGGRVGAASGPFAFRKAFARLSGRDGVHSSLSDEGDVVISSGDVEKNLRQAADHIRDMHAAYTRSLIVGGGNDHAYAQLLGISECLSSDKDRLRLGCINIDPHFDVRRPNPLITSGSPFYLALESGVLSPELFVEFGTQRQCNSEELWKYIEFKKISVVPFEKLRHGKAAGIFEKTLAKLSARCDAVVICLDLDSVSEAFAPGVSAPSSEGFTPTDIMEIMKLSGADPKVVSLGIFELNPEHDIDHRTARLAATSAYHFIAE